MELLFTDGELDTEKLMCLHTLASHPYEALKKKQFHKPRASHLVPRDVQKTDTTALDKKIERSRLQRGFKKGATNFLPIYVLNLHQRMNNSSRRYDQKWYSEEGRPAKLIAVNRIIIQLISTILEALKSSSPSKIDYLSNLVQHPRLIVNILNKPEHQNFLSSLGELSIIVSSSAFQLSKPYAHHISLDIHEPLQSLKYIVSKIRISILNDSTVFRHYIGSNVNQNTDTMHIKRNNLTLLEEDVLNSSDSSSFVNILSYRTKGFNAEHVSRIITNKVREAFQRDMKELRNMNNMNMKKSITKNEPERKGSLTAQDGSVSNLTGMVELINDIKTADIQNKWKKPFPSAKKYVKGTNSNISQFEADFLRNSQWLNRTIREEEENIYRPLINLETTPRRFIRPPKVQKPMIFSKGNKKSSAQQKKTNQYIYNFGYKPNESQNILNNINLAKLKHEVSVIENSRRVKKFLDTPLFKKNTYS